MDLAYVVGTFDTKGEELRYVAGLLRDAGHEVTTVDVGTSDPARRDRADVGPREVAGAERCSPATAGARSSAMSRGAGAVACRPATTSRACSRSAAPGARRSSRRPCARCPVGVPKIVVSTVASGNVAPYVGSVRHHAACTRSPTSRGSTASAGGCCPTPRTPWAGPSSTHAVPDAQDKPALGLTMFGVTTPCVTAVTEAVADRWSTRLVFHATGTGGRAMEKLVDDRLVEAVVDVSTTEIADLVVGGIMAATEDRLGAIARTGVPWVGSVGALDMVNFGAPDTVPRAVPRPDALRAQRRR